MLVAALFTQPVQGGNPAPLFCLSVIVVVSQTQDTSVSVNITYHKQIDDVCWLGADEPNTF